MEKLTLEEIASAIGGTAPKKGETDNICTDTRKLTPGCVFVALSGDRFDGHDFIKTAMEGGAIAAVTERQVGDFPCIITGDTRKALLDLSKYYRKKFEPVLVGVTGSVGKTTTKEMIALALSAKYNTMKTEGNLNNEIGLPLTLFRMDSETEAAVIEMGMSHFGEIHRLSSASQPTMAVITNIGFSHMENLGSQEGILKAKLEILDGMEMDAPLIVNNDDEFLAKLDVDRNILTYGIDSEAEIRAIDIKSGEGTDFLIRYKKEEYPVHLPCIGKHNVYNALAAFCSGILADIEPVAIISKLQEYVPAGMRQRIERRGDVTLIVDCYNASPDSMKAALSVLSQIEPSEGGRRIAVLADMLELGEQSPKLHENVGELAVDAGIDRLFCYGANAKYIAKRADEMGLHSGCTDDAGMLSEVLRKAIRKGDVVLFKGSRGMKLENIIRDVFGNEGE